MEYILDILNHYRRAVYADEYQELYQTDSSEHFTTVLMLIARYILNNK